MQRKRLSGHFYQYRGNDALDIESPQAVHLKTSGKVECLRVLKILGAQGSAYPNFKLGPFGF